MINVKFYKTPEVKMKIKLIAPSDDVFENIQSSATFKVPRLCLALLAALTPEEHEVTIVDESYAPDNIDEDVDLVGITVMTEMALRAYKIADYYRRKGVKVVMGGIHPTTLPDEAIKHCDAVAMGEAENIWHKILLDAKNNNLQKFYSSDKLTNINELVKPRWDIYPLNSYHSYTPKVITIESSRGCAYSCEFCSIASVYGKKYRVRCVDKVIEEIENANCQNLFFVDDALGLNRNEFIKLLKEMIPLNKKWVGQGTVSLGEDESLIKLMRDAGCVALLLGFETIQEDIQHNMVKITRSKLNFSETVKRFHDYGIAIYGAFVFGFDNEDKHIFERTLDFCLTNKIDFLQLRMLVPFPGTELFARLKREGRLFDDKWWLKGLSTENLLFKPKNFSPEEFVDGYNYLIKNCYSNYSIFKRFFGISPFKRELFDAKLYAGVNIAQRKRYHQLLKMEQQFATKKLVSTF